MCMGASSRKSSPDTGKTSMPRKLALAALLLNSLRALPQGPAVLPKVVLVGDSIRSHYAFPVAKRLEGQAVVVSSATHHCDSSNVLAHLEEWVIREKPDVVHFNCGLHDVQRDRKRNQYAVPLALYEQNLRKIVERLQKETGAALVFATTTPLPDNALAEPNFDRREEDVRRYNRAAVAVMRGAGVVVNDLHGLLEPWGNHLWLSLDGTHLTRQVNDHVATAVSECILRQLAVWKARPQPPPTATADAIAAYRKTEAARDALVPRAYRELQCGVFDVPTNAQAWKARRPEVLQTVLQSLGDLPDRPAPFGRLVSREIRKAYSLEQVAIDNEVDGKIAALVLVPDRRAERAPAVLCLHSSGRDKNHILIPHGEGGDKPLGEALLEAGFVVMAPDAYWHGGRAGTGPSGAAEKGFQEQEDLFKLNQLLGRTLWGMFVRDDQIALNYLCNRPEVDAQRIGATGMSMGSTRSWWLAAVDERIAAAAGVACLTRYQNLIAHGQLRQHGVYYYAHGLLRHFDSEGVIALIAPRPFLAVTGELDAGSPADGIKVIEEKVSAVYEALSARERFRSVRYPDIGHTYTPAMRAEVLAWLERWLKPDKGREPRR
jgi:dienelactone hydrolase